MFPSTKWERPRSPQSPWNPEKQFSLFLSPRPGCHLATSPLRPQTELPAPCPGLRARPGHPAACPPRQPGVPEERSVGLVPADPSIGRRCLRTRTALVSSSPGPADSAPPPALVHVGPRSSGLAACQAHAARDAHTLRPKPTPGTLFGKRDFADVIKGHPGFHGPKPNGRCPSKKQGGQREAERRPGETEASTS